MRWECTSLALLSLPRLAQPSGPASAASGPSLHPLFCAPLRWPASPQRLSLSLSPPCRSLARQRESIARSLVKADEVEAHNAKSKHILRGMGSLWGAFKNLFTREPKDAEEVARKKESARAARQAASGGGGGGGSGASVGGAGAAAAAAAAAAGGGGASAVAAGRGGGAGAAAGSAASAKPLTEEEELLGVISGNLGALKAVGEKIGEEIKLQDGMLDELGAKVVKGSEGLKRNTKESLRQARG